MVYSNAPPLSEEHIVGFIDIWSPITKNLGASLVKPLVNGGPISDKLRFFDLSNDYNFLQQQGLDYLFS